MLDVVTMNGVHASKVVYCKCGSAGDHWEQLLDSSLFPATINKPSDRFSYRRPEVL